MTAIVETLRACLKNSGAGLRPAMNGRLARENTGARRLPHYIFQTRSYRFQWELIDCRGS